jgi:ABC-2 type transport system permease protein
MNTVAIRALVKKDLLTIVRNRGLRIPLIVTPVVVLFLLPTLLVIGGELLVSGSVAVVADPEAVGLPGIASPEVQESLIGQETGPALWTRFVLEVMVAPLYLMVPLMVATVIAADSFAGERERKTLEALLHTATSDRELLTAKFLAAWIPAVTVGWLSFAAYAVLANLLGRASLERIFFPTPTWLLLAFWLAPAVAALGLAVMVVTSSRVRSLQAAHQIGSLLVLPVLALLVAQVAGTLLFDVVTVAILGVVVWCAAAVMLLYGTATLRRQRLAERL